LTNNADFEVDGQGIDISDLGEFCNKFMQEAFEEESDFRADLRNSIN